MSIKNKKYNKSIILIQNLWRKQSKYMKTIQNELNFFNKVLINILNRLKESYNLQIINLIEYKKHMEKIDELSLILKKFPNVISLSYISSNSRYSILLKLAKIKVAIIGLVSKIGTTDLNDLIKLFFGSVINEEYSKYVNFHNSLFNVIKCEEYESDNKNNISFKLKTTGKKKTSSITLASYQIDYPSVNKYNIFTKNLTLKLMGAKLFIPYKNKLLILQGYYTNDDLNTYQNNIIFKKKFNKLQNLFNSLDVNDEFKTNFVKCLSIKIFLLNNPKQLANLCINYYNDLNKFKNKNISQIVKEFIINDVDKQKYMIEILLLDTVDDDSGYLAHLLFDLLKSDNQIPVPKNSDIIFNQLHWNLKKIFKDSDSIVQKINKKIANFNEEIIPYEKRIHLMKASNYVKSKAMDKLKEINNSKNGESNAKAQQYLDGLLKVPFGIYKKEIVRIKLNELQFKYDKLITNIITELNNVEENYMLSDNDLKHTENLITIIDNFKNKKFNPININKFNIKIKNWIKEILSLKYSLLFIYDENSLNIFLNKFKSNLLKDICKKCNLDSKGKKNLLIDRIIQSKYSQDDIQYLSKNLKKLDKKFKLFFETDQFISIIGSLEQINNIWLKYYEVQAKYFKDVSKILDNAVYGLDDPKNQVKRLLAQWINGNDQGYVFGFEGPPGTGKTTLAKAGIANCLKDENNVKRPFVFIALGGSSNGSTLEGHNYTYVGSTWGRIIEGIIDSKCMNPIIYIDELDKISRTEHGKEIVGILTHLTDPSQNKEFTDKYFSGIKFDISKCLIIFSYNDASLIDKILLDRIQRIKIDSLNKVDKIMVCKKHIIPEIIENIGFSNDDIILDESELIYIIDTYTYEAGARKLKEKLYELYREVNLKYLINGENSLPFKIDKDFIDKTFDNYHKVDIRMIHNTPKVGLVNGLYATAAGVGGITIIETFKFISNTHLELKLTGMQGDVMKESMNVAKTLALNLIPRHILKKIKDEEKKNKFGIHIHAPAGATKKDGPSAGTAITVAIVSLLCKIPILNTIGLTGEIDLNGNVLPIGGLESKVDGGKLAGLNHVLCPIKNEKDLKKIRKRDNSPEDENFKIEIISNIYEALDRCLLIPNKQKAINYFNKV